MQISIAGAGAGKTTTMADTIVDLRKKTNENKHIFCITFTNNAVSCIEQKLQRYYGVIPNSIVISTIHSFLYREFIKPYYYLLFGKHYERISIAPLPQNPEYRNMKIRRLEDINILHQTVIPERAKWVVVKKSDDKKTVKDKRAIIKNVFKEYCGGICIDEAQDIDSDMQMIIETLNEIGIPLILMGDPKQDLKGRKCLKNIMEKSKDNVSYIGVCHRCPQKHLVLSNSIVESQQQQYSNKEGGYLKILFENDKPCSELINEEDFDLCYISQKQGKYETHNTEKAKDILLGLSEEIESEMRRLHPNKAELILLKTSHYYAETLLKKYTTTHNEKKAMSETFKYDTLSKKAYGAIINMLLDNSATPDEEKILVSSIDSIKGQEGENCLFILTPDLAAYLFGVKTEDNATKSRLYVALTRSLNKLTIFITKEVEVKYKREHIIDFFENLINA
ncbi:MAG: AAA family ATPase [Candidatus Pelethousia sp.]|nr:AAA family ATPase [Candidatus Pelethousia sp.]